MIPPNDSIRSPQVNLSGPISPFQAGDKRALVLNELAGVLKFEPQTPHESNWYKDAKDRFNVMRQDGVIKTLQIGGTSESIVLKREALRGHVNAIKDIRDEIGTMQKSQGLIGKIRLLYMKMQFYFLEWNSERELRKINKRIDSMPV